jgi:hypothetical protein
MEERGYGLREMMVTGEKGATRRSDDGWRGRQMRDCARRKAFLLGVEVQRRVIFDRERAYATFK